MPQTVLFDRYRLLEPAGRGGSAEVWHAIDEQTGEDVAVKRLHPVVFADEAGRRRLQREFDALHSLDEPHIVRVRDLKIGEREAALILDYIPGESLAQRLAGLAARGERMAPEQAAAIVSDIAAALGAAHAAGIVHRDVTPGNVLLTVAGEARLTDFGIAHASGDAAAVTATGLLMGTLRYLAPEQLRGGISSPASDLHGLAALAYEMLAGNPAYEATSPVALAEAQQAGPAAIPDVAPPVDSIVRRGLAVEPADRPADVAAFAASLAGALADDATAPIPLEPRDRTAALVLPAAAARGSIGPTGAPGDDVGVALPSRAAAAYGPMPQSVGPSDAEQAGEVWSLTPRARAARPRRGRGVPTPLAAVVGLALAVGLVAAAANLDRGSPNGRPVVAADPPSAHPSATAAPTPSATPAPTPTPQPSKGKGGGKDHGKGGG